MNKTLISVQEELKEKNLDAALISSVADIIYLTGFSNFSNIERECFLLIAKNNRYIITDGRYSYAVKKEVKDFELIEISPDNSLSYIFKNLSKKHRIKKLGIDENNLTITEYKKLKHFGNTFHYNIDSLRAVKNQNEIVAIEKACNLGDRTFTYILGKIKKGVSEKELAFEIEYFIKKNGADISFKPIVAFGVNASAPHHLTNDQRLKTNDWILLDFGVKLDHYCSDMTRTVFIGKATAEEKRIYQTVLDAQSKAIEYLNHQSSIINHKSIKASEVDHAARAHIISQGYPTIPHSVGHGIGIEVHEAPTLSPNSKDILKDGMVFSVEPGIYLNGKMGIRIEDLVVLTNRGPKLLTHSPKKLTQL